MKVLVGKTFGMGNAVMAIPMLKALKTIKEIEYIDVLIGSRPDDVGAYDVFKNFALNSENFIRMIHFDEIDGIEYDVAIMSIPFDGRWVNGKHFKAKRVIDCRPRPEPFSDGMFSWKKHEIEYQMENAELLGYSGDIPDTSFFLDGLEKLNDKDVYLGVGYKKDKKSFWSRKNLGTTVFMNFCKEYTAKYTDASIISTGDIADWQATLKSLSGMNIPRFEASITNLTSAFLALSKCGLYVGNDTGMMHVAASMGIPCVAAFFIDNSITKNRPWGEMHRYIDGTQLDSVTHRELLWCVEEIFYEREMESP